VTETNQKVNVNAHSMIAYLHMCPVLFQRLCNEPAIILNRIMTSHNDQVI